MTVYRHMSRKALPDPPLLPLPPKKRRDSDRLQMVFVLGAGALAELVIGLLCLGGLVPGGFGEGLFATGIALVFGVLSVIALRDWWRS